MRMSRGIASAPGVERDEKIDSGATGAGCPKRRATAKVVVAVEKPQSNPYSVSFHQVRDEDTRIGHDGAEADCG